MKSIYHLFSAICGLFFVSSLFSSCTEEHRSFANPSEALDACRQELSLAQSKTDMSISELSELTTTWIEIQDSAIACFLRDSTIRQNKDFANAYFLVADSFRVELKRLALSQPRPIGEIVNYKVATAKDRESIISSKDYSVAQNFYKQLDKKTLYPNLDVTLKEYSKLLKGAYLKNEKQLREFITQEDRCFRSLLLYLKDCSPDKLQAITDNTADLFDNLYRNASVDTNNEVNKRVIMYLSMRFNRRIIQNAETCMKDIQKDSELDYQQRVNYRWMLIQPFIIIDNNSMAYLTNDEISSMKSLAGQLPQLLAYIDGKDYTRSSNEEKVKLQNTLSEYFLKSYLSVIL